ncbi:MAG TPA: PLP-dependent lyase/thiolase [archaeon]|nr:PLP-dependent lyase/thiolase [archaeon]
MKKLHLECINCRSQYSYKPDLFTCTKCSSKKFTNLLVKDPELKFTKKSPFELEKTPCYRIESLCNRTNIQKLFIKDETFNSSGTMKDRRSELLVDIARQNGYRKIFCVTAANLGKSLGAHSRKNEIECIALAPKTIPKKVMAQLQKQTSTIVVDDLDDPNQCWTSDMVQKAFPDSLDGTSNNPAAIYAYKNIASEVAHISPDYIIVPLGSGELFCGICQEIEEKKMNTKVVGVTIKGKNPIEKALHENTNEYLHGKINIERTLNKIQVNYTPLIPIILHFISRGHKFIEIEEEQMKDAIYEYQPYFEHSIENSSFCVFAALEKFDPHIKEKKVVCVLTGRVNSQEAITHI